MFTVLSLAAFLFGLIIGSFLNVVILRHGTETLAGRSRCPHCRKLIHWYENVPVLSYLALRGRCAGCRTPLSLQYPLVELAVGFLFVALFFFVAERLAVTAPEAFLRLAPLSAFLLLSAVWSTLVAIFVYDLYHKIIPDRFVFTFIGLSVLWFLFFLHPGSLLSLGALLDGLSGPLLFLFFGSLWYFSGGRWMGFGDAKLALGMGFLLGLSGGLAAVLLAFWIGAAVAVLLLCVGSLLSKLGTTALPPSLKRLTIKSEVPFAPFLIIGTAIAFFGEVDALGLLLFITSYVPTL